MTQDLSYFCPTCGTPSIETSQLIGSNAKCLGCGWSGSKEDLAVHRFTHGFTSEEDVQRAFVADFKQLMGEYIAVPLAALLMKWGFFSGAAPTPKELTRYIVVMSKASITALLEERAVIEKERISRGS